MNWQPIGTAPKDGSKFLAFDRAWYDVPFVCYWGRDRWRFNAPGDNDVEMRPAFWMPLPELPEVAA